MIPKKIKELIDKAYKAENKLNTSVSEIAKIAQQYTDTKLHGTWVAGDGPVIGWEYTDLKELDINNVIPPERFFEEVSKLEKGQKLSEDDLNRISI